MDILAVLDGMQKARAELIAERDRMVIDLQKKTQDIEHANGFIRAYQRQHGIPEEIDANDLAAFKTNHEALVHIARQNNGVLRLKEARNAFLAAGRAKTRVNAGPTVVVTIKSKPACWEKVGEGTWKLVEPPNVSSFRAAGGQ